MAYKYTKAYPALVAKLDRNPTDEEMSEEIGEPLSRIKRIRLLPVVDSFEKPVVNSSKKLKDNSTVGTIIEDAYVDTSGNAHTRPAEELLKNAQLSHIVRVAYKCLNDNEKLVMEGRFPQEGHQKTLEQLARELSVTQERIRQIEAKALEKIEKALKQTLGEDNFSKNDKKEAGKEVQNLVKLIDKCDNLTEIEKYILEKRHAVNGKKMTLAEIQNEKGLYPRNVYTIEQSAFKKLKKTAERIKESDTI